MPTFSEIFGDADNNRRVIVPGLAEYYTAPTRENARVLLVSLGLPVPYAALVQSAAAAAASRRKTPSDPPSEQSDEFTLKSESSSSGGGRSRRAKSRAGPSAPPPQPSSPPKYVARLQTVEPQKLFEAHRLIDLLHDLLDMKVSDKLQERIYRLFRVSPGVIAKLKKLVSKAYESPSAVPWVNHRLTDIAEALAGLSSPRSHTLAFKPDHTLVATDMDLYLHAAVSRWYARPSLEIVLDGIFRDVALPRADRIGAKTSVAVNKHMNDSDVAKSLTLCAYLQLVITDWDTANPAVRLITPRAPHSQRAQPIQTKEIMFLIGDFQTLDVPGADHFIREWISYIKTETEYLSHLSSSAIGTRRIAVADMPPLTDTPFANVAVNPSGLSVKLSDRPNVTGGAMLRAIQQGTFVPYSRKRAKRTDGSRGGAPPSLADRYRTAFFTSNPKSWLQTVFDRYRDEEDLTPETNVFIETLTVVNAFRDAIRAEVALARDAVYITIDALALVYYQARADRTAGASKKSNGLMIHPAGQENLSIKYYSPSAAARASATRAAGI
jgi:hypothetical protein